jgi:hypothetical protein
MIKIKYSITSGLLEPVLHIISLHCAPFHKKKNEKLLFKGRKVEKLRGLVLNVSVVA